jgi:hypothetical protein
MPQPVINHQPSTINHQSPTFTSPSILEYSRIIFLTKAGFFCINRSAVSSLEHETGPADRAQLVVSNPLGTVFLLGMKARVGQILNRAIRAKLTNRTRSYLCLI